MSTFKVTVERLEKVWNHPNADRLQLAKVEGMSFQFCVAKDTYKTGDLVIFFPVDSILPADLIAHFGISNFLAGRDKNRLKTVRLRGEVSQGFVWPYNDKVLAPRIPFGGMQFAADGISPGTDVGNDLTSVLGVTKYEPPEIPCHAGNLIQHPEGVSHYDIEGCQRFPNVLAKLMDQQVFISEKLEGSNHYTSILPDGKIVVGQRNYQVQPIEGHVHDWWKAAENAKHFEILKQCQSENPGKQITIRSEIVGPGISGNIYGLKNICLFTFDILIDGKYLSANDFINFCRRFSIKTVPILGINVTLQEWLSGRTIEEAANGLTVLGISQGIWREGLVIKPIEEQYDSELGGRLFLKMRDPIYLDKTGN